jgi:hypothetical protein
MIDAQLPSQLDEFRCGRKIREETGRPPRVAPVAWKFRGAARCRCATAEHPFMSVLARFHAFVTGCNTDRSWRAMVQAVRQRDVGLF